MVAARKNISRKLLVVDDLSPPPGPEFQLYVEKARQCLRMTSETAVRELQGLVRLRAHYPGRYAARFQRDDRFVAVILPESAPHAAASRLYQTLPEAERMTFQVSFLEPWPNERIVVSRR